MTDTIRIQGAREHNLKNVSVDIPRNTMTVCTGLSGSGKSSLIFDTIFAEGQRRYLESLSAYARQFLNQLDKPDVDQIDGLSPSISIDQKSGGSNPRSTVGTVTEIYDYLRLLFASIGTPHCPSCHQPMSAMSIAEMTQRCLEWAQDDKVLLLAPLVRNQKGAHKSLIETCQKNGFSRLRVNGEICRIDEAPDLKATQKHTIELVVDRVSVSKENESRLFQSIETTAEQGQGIVVIEKQSSSDQLTLSEALMCFDCNTSFDEVTHRLFSFNSPIGACPSCKGLGTILDFDPRRIIQQPEEPIRTSTGKIINLDNTYYGDAANQLARSHGFSLDTPYCDLTETQKNLLFYGHTEPIELHEFWNGDADHLISPMWEGICNNLRRRYRQTHSDGMRFFMRSYMTSHPCTTCHGSRLNPLARSVMIQDQSIDQLTRHPIHALLTFFTALSLSDVHQKIAGHLLREITHRLTFLNNVGLNYLTLHRQSNTLSGGEFQRIRLASQIGAKLTGVLYVLDEPSIGLHPRDNQKLIDSLKQLRDLGNTLLIVEHDEDTIRQCDYVIEVGPGAGRLGGEIEFCGPIDDFNRSDTLTARYLNGAETIEVPKKRRPKAAETLRIVGAQEHNLKKVSVDFPLHQFICVTGVSGSGKSTLIYDILHKALMAHFYQSHDQPGQHDRIEGIEHLDQIITIDQSPIGRTPRSNPATYIGVFTPIRELFAKTKEARIRGYKAGRFSFNVKGGRCESCEGDGQIKIDMHFLSDVYVQCDSCKGARYNSETLQVTYKGKSISDILNLTVREALILFENIPAIKNKLQVLSDVGLGYIHLGQNATTLSGGEAQRIKLAKELSKRAKKHTLYLLDEPTTGLHMADIKQLLVVLNRLVDQGHSLIVIEHQLDIIKCADYIIDLGPEGGDKGGKIIAKGRPEEIIKSKKSLTGQHLKPLLRPTQKTSSKK